MCYDPNRKSIWINSIEGLLEFTLHDKQFHAIAACNELMDLNNFEMIAGIELDWQGRVLLYRYTKGIIIYDPIAQTVQPLISDPDLQNQVSDENMSIYCDRDGMIWCGYLPVKGIYQLIPFSSSVSRLPFHTDQPINKSTIPVKHMAQADHGHIWLSTMDGLNIFDPLNSSLKHLNQPDFPGVKGENIIPLGTDSIHQKAWLHTGNSGTFYEMDILSRMCRRMTVKGMNHKEIINIYPNYNTISPYKKGLVFLVDKTGIFTINRDSAVVQQVLEIPYHVTNMAVAAQKRIFLRLHFANTNLSYYETNGKWVQTATALDSIEWSCIFYDTNSESYWAGGLKRLYHKTKWRSPVTVY
jgi:ligand-binding sensor domain-containing protein